MLYLVGVLDVKKLVFIFIFIVLSLNVAQLVEAWDLQTEDFEDWNTNGWSETNASVPNSYAERTGTYGLRIYNTTNAQNRIYYDMSGMTNFTISFWFNPQTINMDGTTMHTYFFSAEDFSFGSIVGIGFDENATVVVYNAMDFDTEVLEGALPTLDDWYWFRVSFYDGASGYAEILVNATEIWSWTGDATGYILDGELSFGTITAWVNDEFDYFYDDISIEYYSEYEADEPWLTLPFIGLAGLICCFAGVLIPAWKISNEGFMNEGSIRFGAYGALLFLIGYGLITCWLVGGFG